MSFTKCCNLRYIGENHNPVRDGICLNCGASESTTNQLDIIAHNRVQDILEFAEDNPWFDAEFILKMDKQSSYSSGQRKAIENIWDKFCNN